MRTGQILRQESAALSDYGSHRGEVIGRDGLLPCFHVAVDLSASVDSEIVAGTEPAMQRGHGHQGGGLHPRRRGDLIKNLLRLLCCHTGGRLAQTQIDFRHDYSFCMETRSLKQEISQGSYQKGGRCEKDNRQSNL